MERSDYVPTSIAVRMTARLRATHKRRGISVFSGPPGLGKTTAIEQFAIEFPGSVAVVKIATQGVRELGVMQHALEALRNIRVHQGWPRSGQGTFEARHDLASEISAWAHNRIDTRIRNPDLEREAGPLSLVFDEAQNLSRNAIECLRYWNDRDRCYGPFPIGLVFVGNNEFALKADKSGTSAISAAVADRSLYIERFEYADLSNADLRLFLSAKGIGDPGALDALMKHFSTPRVPRSLRQVLRVALDVLDEAAGDPVTAAHVWAVIAPA